MKIKKPMNGPAAGGPGGAAIADRFRLDVGQPAKPKASSGSKVAAGIALVAALIALGGLGMLAWNLHTQPAEIFEDTAS